MPSAASSRPPRWRGSSAVAARGRSPIASSLGAIRFAFPSGAAGRDDGVRSCARSRRRARASAGRTDRARAQIARELDLIEKLDLAGYFLIVWDMVNFCRRQDILVQGAARPQNSAVCYSLGITAVDPVGMDLLFERFLSEERGEWPDIDIDLPSGDRRERVIQHVYENAAATAPPRRARASA